MWFLPGTTEIDRKVMFLVCLSVPKKWAWGGPLVLPIVLSGGGVPLDRTKGYPQTGPEQDQGPLDRLRRGRCTPLTITQEDFLVHLVNSNKSSDLISSGSALVWIHWSPQIHWWHIYWVSNSLCALQILSACLINSRNTRFILVRLVNVISSMNNFLSGSVKDIFACIRSGLAANS